VITGGWAYRILTVIVVALASGPAAIAGDTTRVLMKSIAFEPRQVTVHVGDTVEWANEDIVAHTATARDRSWEVNVLPGRSGRLVMKSAGAFSYICRYHPNMTGEIIVEHRRHPGTMASDRAARLKA
jgi:plastocyanin